MMSTSKSQHHILPHDAAGRVAQQGHNLGAKGLVLILLIAEG